jgi:hypothetical protein
MVEFMFTMRAVFSTHIVLLVFDRRNIWLSVQIMKILHFAPSTYSYDSAVYGKNIRNNKL